jgi:hypothetical protein
VREALRALVRDGRARQVDVWGRQGWGHTAHAYRAAGAAQLRLPAAAAA